MKIVLFFSLLIITSFLYPRVALQKKHCVHRFFRETDPSKIEPQYPSYIFKGENECGVRASQDLEAGVVVGTNDCTVTDKEYIAGHESVEHRHVMVIGVSQDGKPIFGRAWGKGAYINHSCDANCKSIDGNIITNRPVKKDEELTTSYDQFFPGVAWDSKWNFECKCNALNCRLTINSYKH